MTLRHTLIRTNHENLLYLVQAFLDSLHRSVKRIFLRFLYLNLLNCSLILEILINHSSTFTFMQLRGRLLIPAIARFPVKSFKDHSLLEVFLILSAYCFFPFNTLVVLFMHTHMRLKLETVTLASSLFR